MHKYKYILQEQVPSSVIKYTTKFKENSNTINEYNIKSCDNESYDWTFTKNHTIFEKTEINK